MNAMNAHRQMIGNTATAGKSMEKLSSGLRINRAGDDAAGLAISEKMRGQIRGLDQASRNSQDSISLIQTAEGALNETHSILQRMRELGVQASNGTLTTDDRNAIQSEVDQLVDEIDRIGNTTEFNTKKLLNGEASGVQIATGSDKMVSSELTGANNYEGTLTVAITTAAEAQIQTSTGATDDAAVAVGFTGVAGTDTLATTFGATAFGGNESFTIAQDGKSVTVDLSGTDTFNQVVSRLNTAFENEGMAISASFSTADADAGLVFTATKVGSDYDVTITENNFDNGATFGFDTTGASGNASVDAVLTLTDASLGGSGNLTVTGDQLIIDNSTNTGATTSLDLNNMTIDLTQAALSSVATLGTIEVGEGGVISQIGANQSQTMSINIGDMRASKLGTGSNVSSTFANINDLKATGLTSTSNAAKAITLIDKAISDVSEERAKLGSYQNRLEHTIANLGTSSENLQSAESRIRDVDMAKEMMTFSKNNILSQAAQAMLAQANQQPQGVLQLLR